MNGKGMFYWLRSGLFSGRDALTGLPAYEALRALFEKGKFAGREYVLVRMDIGRFKVVNAVYGHEVGNDVLASVGRIWSECVPAGGTGCKCENDVFVAVMPEKEAMAFVGKVSERVKKLEVAVCPYFGLAVLRDLEGAMDEARMAVRTVKGDGINNAAHFQPRMAEEEFKRMSLESCMERALLNGEFVPYYHPKFQVRTGRMNGAEALARWKRPGQGIIPPDEFVPFFEENGFILKMDVSIWRQVCECLGGLVAHGYAVPISINVSRVHVAKGGCEVVQTLNMLTRCYGVPRSYLEIELTESAFTKEEGRISAFLDEARKNGYRTAMDDFGCGYSNLRMLGTSGMDCVKFDKCFMDGLEGNERMKGIVSSLLELVSSMGFETVVEGVETEEQLDFVKGTCCGTVQGYYMSEPMPGSEFEPYVQIKAGLWDKS